MQLKRNVKKTMKEKNMHNEKKKELKGADRVKKMGRTKQAKKKEHAVIGVYNSFTC